MSYVENLRESDIIFKQKQTQNFRVLLKKMKNSRQKSKFLGRPKFIENKGSGFHKKICRIEINDSITKLVILTESNFSCTNFLI